MSKLSGRAQWNTANAKLANEPFANLFDDPSRVCVRCGREYIERNKVHTRLYGVMCVCGSQEWKAVEQRLQADVLVRCVHCDALIETNVHCDNCGSFHPTRR